MFSKPFYTPVFTREHDEETKKQSAIRECQKELKYVKIDVDEEYDED